MTKPFVHCFRVRHSEADPPAVVFNSRYLEYVDLATGKSQAMPDWLKERMAAAEGMVHG